MTSSPSNYVDLLGLAFALEFGSAMQHYYKDIFGGSLRISFRILRKALDIPPDGGRLPGASKSRRHFSTGGDLH